MFEMLWVQQQPASLSENWNEYQHLCKQGLAVLILNKDDYYAFFTVTMFHG
jgi:hypothetical protein